MSTPFFQPVDPTAAPDPVTPADSPGDAAGWAQVTPAGQGPAPYDISGPQDIAGIAGALAAAMDLSGGQEGTSTGAGIPNRDSPRQQQAAAILDSPQGAESSNVFAGFPDYENQDLDIDSDLNTPIQGAGYHPGTMQDGIPMYGGQEGAGVEGVPPEGGSMDTPGGNYPGTTQSGITTYGTG